MAFGWSARSDCQEVIVFEVFFLEFLLGTEVCLEVGDFLLELGADGGFDGFSF